MYTSTRAAIESKYKALANSRKPSAFLTPGATSETLEESNFFTRMVSSTTEHQKQARIICCKDLAIVYKRKLVERGIKVCNIEDRISVDQLSKLLKFLEHNQHRIFTANIILAVGYLESALKQKEFDSLSEEEHKAIFYCCRDALRADPEMKRTIFSVKELMDFIKTLISVKVAQISKYRSERGEKESNCYDGNLRVARVYLKDMLDRSDLTSEMPVVPEFQEKSLEPDLENEILFRILDELSVHNDMWAREIQSFEIEGMVKRRLGHYASQIFSRRFLRRMDRGEDSIQDYFNTATEILENVLYRDPCTLNSSLDASRTFADALTSQKVSKIYDRVADSLSEILDKFGDLSENEIRCLVINLTCRYLYRLEARERMYLSNVASLTAKQVELRDNEQSLGSNLPNRALGEPILNFERLIMSPPRLGSFNPNIQLDYFSAIERSIEISKNISNILRTPSDLSEFWQNIREVKKQIAEIKAIRDLCMNVHNQINQQNRLKQSGEEIVDHAKDFLVCLSNDLRDMQQVLNDYIKSTKRSFLGWPFGSIVARD